MNLETTCLVCETKITKGSSVLFLCECVVVYCKSCAYRQIAAQVCFWNFHKTHNMCDDCSHMFSLFFVRFFISASRQHTMKDSHVQFAELCQIILKASKNVKKKKVNSLKTPLNMQVLRKFLSCQYFHPFHEIILIVSHTILCRLLFVSHIDIVACSI